MNYVTKTRWPGAKIKHLDLVLYLWNSMSMDSMADTRRGLGESDHHPSFSPVTVFALSLENPEAGLGPFSSCHRNPVEAIMAETKWGEMGVAKGKRLLPR